MRTLVEAKFKHFTPNVLLTIRFAVNVATTACVGVRVETNSIAALSVTNPGTWSLKALIVATRLPWPYQHIPTTIMFSWIVRVVAAICLAVLTDLSQTLLPLSDGTDQMVRRVTLMSSVVVRLIATNPRWEEII